jgi:hypothetical protein
MNPREERSKEVPLGGGNITPVVRVGSTVRRTLNSWSGTIQLLLQHLESKGYRGAPRFLGLDAEGREILTYLPGRVGVPPYPLPSFVWADEALREVGKLLRELHDATEDFRPEYSAWAYPAGEPGEVVCHNDAAPYNTVFEEGLPTAFIDWDIAGSGPRVWDLAFVAWRWVPLYSDAMCVAIGADPPPDRRERLLLLCESYGWHSPALLLEAVRNRQREHYEGMKQLAETGDPIWVRLWDEGHAEGILRDIQYLDENYDFLRRDLR